MNFEAWAAIDTVEIDATQVSSKMIKMLSPDSYISTGDISILKQSKPQYKLA